MRQLSTEWTRHISDPERKKSFEDTVRNSTAILTRLQLILQDKINTINSQELSLSDYDTPSWEHKQAHRNGMRQAYRDLEKLLNFLEG